MIPELLAPAKNLATAIAAINHGADAVYMGAPKFSARDAAGNTLADIAQAVRYAHRYGAKLYLALNTILFDHELESAQQLATQACDLGCDALIIQDMAFLEMDLPPIALHASTQCHNATPEKVKFLQTVGIKRVILSRELSLPQIAAVRSHTGVELEAFVHGALCVSYSGQCYLSQALTNRSANRGVCAQPCRSAYNLEDAQGNILLKNQHLLSLRDLNLSQYLQQLAELGVSSFKIEGRLKNEDYVKNVVAHYRQTIDALPYFAGKKRASSGTVHLNFEPQPQKSFSRGFTDYFIGNKKNIANHLTPKSLGEEVGCVTRLESQSLQVALKQGCTLSPGDGICFFNNRSQLQGSNINKVESSRIWMQNNQGMAAGTLLFRNFDIAFDRQLSDPNSARRQIAVHIDFRSTQNQVTILARDEDNVEFCLSEHCEFTAAKDETRAKQAIVEQFRKSGTTIFKVMAVDLHILQPAFYPTALLNQWRRAVLEGLEQMRQKAYSPQKHFIEKNTIPYPQQQLDYRANVSNSLATLFYRRHGATQIAPAFELSPPPHAPLMTCRYCLLRELGKCKKEHPLTWQEPLFLENNGQKLQLHFDCRNCQMLLMG